MGFARKRTNAAVAVAAAILLIAVLIDGLGGGGPAGPPLPGIGRPARSGDPFAYVAAHAADFEARATVGSAHVLFAKSPGGVIATAARVSALRGLIDSAAAGTGVDPNVLEAIVFVESAGRPDVIAGADPSAAAGLTQILAETGQSLLGMHIDLPQSRKLTRAIDGAYAQGKTALVARLQRRRATIDDRFVPRKALAATVRYLRLAGGRFGRADLAVVSYHMGIGNLQQVLDDYDGGRAVPYVQLYFDTAPDHHTAAYNLLSGFGDDSSLYYWRVLAALQIMRLYRVNAAALNRLATLQTAAASNVDVLHPPDRTGSFSDPTALSEAYAKRVLLPLPANAANLGLAYDPAIGALAPRLKVPPALYRGLRVPALDLLIELAIRVRAIAGGSTPLTVAGSVADGRYERAAGISDPSASTGYAFQIARRYGSRRQALAFQAMLDRLQSLNLIAWTRGPATIDVTVASDASRVIVNGP